VEDDVPTYQYACTACGHQLEAVQTFADEPLSECPACEGRLRKLYSSVGIVFKGSGFYRTDSRTSAGGAKKDEARSETPKTDSGAKKEPAAASSSAAAKPATASTSS
jgi:putative FmdB family regulatory protein